jgi:2-hydroxychromene-2-carboxylate isomerase
MRYACGMKTLIFHFDVVSPYAYLAFERLPHALAGLSHAVRYRPLLFAGLLKHWGQLGPAEIAPKRDWTYRQMLWLAQAHGVVLQPPAAHPFNPLALLRLLVAAGIGGEPNRAQCEAAFAHVWRSGGAAADDPQRTAALEAQLAQMAGGALPRAPQSDAVKAQLRAHTEAALARGIFGVPTIEVDDKLFWGFDALPMLAAYLRGDAWFASGAWERAAQLPAGAARMR